MIKFITSPQDMRLSDVEEVQYEQILELVTEVSLNLMAVKVEERPDDFLAWCIALHKYVKFGINRDLLDAHLEKPLTKLIKLLSIAISAKQVKTSRITPWPFWVNFIQTEGNNQALSERLRLLKYISSIRLSKLADMSELERLAFAGKHLAAHDPANYDFDVELFNSTRGVKALHDVLVNEPSSLDVALECIPVDGEVAESDYRRFVEAYTNAFSVKPNLFAATRLLSMRRPDIFISLNAAKVDPLCQGFGLVKLNAQDFGRYWVDVIEPIHRQPWFNSSIPSDEFEVELWQNRAVLFDLFFHAEDDLAVTSNFNKLKNKPLSSRATSSRSTSPRAKKTKESATEAVDRILADPELPSYLLDKRSSIIAEVTKGKSPTEVIALIRAIFG